jgi:hypothetical protein
MEFPFNIATLSDKQLKEIRTAYEETRTWPKVEIQIFITAGAYTGESDLETLKELRGKAAKAYLTELGVRSENIYVGTKTMTDYFVVTRPNGEPVVRAIDIELTPICGGDCQWMCDAALKPMEENSK